jgi:G3E family GTPase
LNPKAPIPVNLITGFLGVGKTTAVAHLLAQHPPDQHWAVLVNEFGEIGIDRALLADAGVSVQEVAGGCLCCVAAPAFTTGLNRLIRQQRPDRILIEPSGLGHPAQVLETLNGPLYAGILETRATLCLMDARHLASPRHREHPNFQDQIHLADVLVGNKYDLYGPRDVEAFERHAAALQPAKSRLAMVTHGRVDPAWLDLTPGDGRRAAFPEAHAFLVETDGSTDTSSPPLDWLVIEGNGDGYSRCGWTVVQRRRWLHTELDALLAAIDVERRKGLFLTDRGWQTYNDGNWQSCRPPKDGRTRLQLIDVSPPDRAAIDTRLRALDAD